MSYMEIFKDIKENRFDNIYLFSGEEEYVKQEALEQLIAAIVSPTFKDMNYQNMDGTEVRVDEIINACETLPFMADRRLVLVRDSVFFTKKKTNRESYSAEDEKRLKGYIENIPKTSHLVFYVRNDVDKRTSLYRAIKKQGSAVDFARLKDHEIKRWVVRELGVQGKNITNGALDTFVQLTGGSLEDVKNELLKLIAFAYEKETITEEDVMSTITPTLEYSIFQLVEAIGNRDTETALKLLYDMLDRGEVFYSILPMIGRQIRLILLCKFHNQKGYTNSQIAKTLKIHPYGVGKYISQGRNFTESELTKALGDCLELDHSIKQGGIEDRLGLEMLIISMCTLKKSFL